MMGITALHLLLNHANVPHPLDEAVSPLFNKKEERVPSPLIVPLRQKIAKMPKLGGVSQDFVENIFSVHYGRCQSLVSEPFSGIDIVSA
ncbi:hypothetical protein P4531_13375, partial [Geobacillus stearothermophilus]|nr:hypothetical protein [Geobacillus stearothermophilus]